MLPKRIGRTVFTCSVISVRVLDRASPPLEMGGAAPQEPVRGAVDPRHDTPAQAIITITLPTTPAAV